MSKSIYSKEYKLVLAQLKNARIEAGLTQEEVAKRIGTLRVIVWVILYLLEHTSKNFESKIFLITKTVSPSLYHPNLIIKSFDKA